MDFSFGNMRNIFTRLLPSKFENQEKCPSHRFLFLFGGMTTPLTTVRHSTCSNRGHGRFDFPKPGDFPAFSPLDSRVELFCFFHLPGIVLISLLAAYLFWVTPFERYLSIPPQDSKEGTLPGGQRVFGRGGSPLPFCFFREMRSFPGLGQGAPLFVFPLSFHMRLVSQKRSSVLFRSPDSSDWDIRSPPLLSPLRLLISVAML